MRKIIGFAYGMSTGKTTAAKYLEGKYQRPSTVYQMPGQRDYYFKRDNFAKSLKEGIGKMVFGLTEEQLNDPILKETIDPYWDMTPRKIMQLAGTEAMRNTFHQDIWVRTLEKRIKAADVNAMFAIDDVRYVNEAEAIKSWGGIVVHINRDTKKQSTHISETEMQSYKDFDYTIDNNSTFTYLYGHLDKIVEEYIGK